MRSTRLWRRTCLFLLAVTLLVTGVAVGGEPAQAATSEARIGSQGGFAASWQLAWLSDAELAWELDGMANSGAKWLRLDFNWPSVQPTYDSWNWQATDRVVRAATARGLQILAMPAYTPAWARGAGTDDKYPPSDRQTYARFVQAAARRYRPMGVRHWEIWNEPNQWYWWKPKPDPWAYTDLLRRAYVAVKAEDPYATVVAGGLAPAPDSPDGSEVNGETFARRMYQAGAKGSFDALAMHPYNYPVEPMYPHPANAFSSTTPAIHRVMSENGDGWKKLWLTEYGAPTSGGSRSITEAKQAEFLVKAYDQVARWPWAGPLLYYSYRDQGWDAGNPLDNYGLLRRDWRWKSGMSAFKAEMAKPISTGSRLASGQLLGSGGSLRSADLRYSLAVQNDGNLVVYDTQGRALWSSRTYGNPGASLRMQSDGNLVLYATSGRALWSSRTYGNGGAGLVMQNDGNLVLYSSAGRPLWSTGTYER